MAKNSVQFIKERGKILAIAILPVFIMVNLISTASTINAQEFEPDLVNVKSVIKPERRDLITENILAHKAEEARKRQAAEKYASKVRRSWKATPGERWTTATAYSSTVDQCDASPCITADGYNVCKAGVENVIAANFLPFGTKVKIPELYGDREFIVHDRMNRRYSNRVDIWMTDRSKAIQFGKRKIKIEVVE